MSSFKTVLLDMDGTLVDSRADLVSAVNHVLVQMQYEPQKPEEIVSRIGNGLRQLLSDTLGLTDAVVLTRAKTIFEEFYHEHCVDQTILYSGVNEILKQSHGRIHMAVVTNKPEAYAEKIAEQLGIKPYLDCLIGGDTLAFVKPHPAPLQAAMQKVRADPASTLMVGDGWQDIEAAHAAGVKSCVVTYGFGYQSGWLDYKPDFAIDHFLKLKEILL